MHFLHFLLLLFRLARKLARRRRTNLLLIAVSVIFFTSWFPLNTLNMVMDIFGNQLEAVTKEVDSNGDGNYHSSDDITDSNTGKTMHILPRVKFDWTGLPLVLFVNEALTKTWVVRNFNEHSIPIYNHLIRILYIFFTLSYFLLMELTEIIFFAPLALWSTGINICLKKTIKWRVCLCVHQ